MSLRPRETSKVFCVLRLCPRASRDGKVKYKTEVKLAGGKKKRNNNNKKAFCCMKGKGIGGRGKEDGTGENEGRGRVHGKPEKGMFTHVTIASIKCHSVTR